MKKRLCSLLLSAVLLLTLLPASPARAASVTAFSDVSSDAWFAPYVYALVQQGVINGMTPTTFAPQERLTRAQLMKMLACYAADEQELQSFAGAKTFPDVKPGAWYETYVNWAAEKEIAAGYNDGTFAPNKNVTRAEAATLAARFAQKSGATELEPTAEKVKFKDDAKLPGWAKENIYLCRRAGIISGYPDGTFRGNDLMTRAEAAKVLCGLFGVAPMDPKDLPVNPVADVQSVTGKVPGYNVTGIMFDPRAYQAGITLAKNQFHATESASSMVSRSGALIACNGAFFDNAGDLTTWSSMIRNGRALRIDNAHAGKTCYFVVDQNGAASMQFMKVLQTAALVRDGEELYRYDEVGCNFSIGEGDGSRMVFTREFGKTVPIKMKCALFCDKNGVVTRVLESSTAQTITIPDSGFVLCTHHRRDEGQDYKWDKFFHDAKVGDTVKLTLSYDNSSVQNIRMAFSCGPTVVKNGKVYGNRDTYAAEGFTEGKVVSGAARRMAIGVRGDGKVVMASAVCDMKGLGEIMRMLGCETAMNLDGGAYCALYVGGSARISPDRELTHMIVFTKR